MNILMISSYLPYPLYSGGQVRLYNLIRELSGKHDITLICEKRDNQTDEDIRAVEKICKKVITVNRRKQWSISNILKSGFSKHSFLTTGHFHSEMREKIREAWDREKFDLIHIETFYVLHNVPETTTPIVLAEHNIEYLVYRKFVEQSPAFLRPLLALDVKKIQQEEEESWMRARRLIAVSDEDKQVMEAVGRTPSIVSNGVNTEHFTFKNMKQALAQKEKRLLFIGDFKWIQNRDAVTFIINEVWPLLRQGYGGQALKNEVKLWIVGRSIPDEIKSLTSDPDVLFDEESSSKPTWEIFQEASVLLAPIRVGGGTSYKILESMACGTPVVTMELSANAIGAKDEEQIMVGQTAQELAEKAVKLLHNARLYEKIARNGRSLIEKRYTWKVIAKTLDEVYKSVY